MSALHGGSLSISAGVWPVMLTPFTSDGAIDWGGVDALTDWYISAGVSGLFTVCLSSEMYCLSDDEKLSLAQRVVKRADGRVPVVASGTFDGAIEDQAEFVLRVAGTGVRAVVVLVCRIAGEEENDDIWRAKSERLLDLTESVPLGLYECPGPYHRLLSPELLSWAASTGRFVFHKDTSCAIDPIRAKLDVLKTSSLKWFNANTPTLLASLQYRRGWFLRHRREFLPRTLCVVVRVPIRTKQRLHLICSVSLALRKT